MEFLIGAIATILAFLAIRATAVYDLSKNSKISIRYSQSHVHDLTKEFIPDQLFLKKQRDTQATGHEKSMYTRVVFVDNEAYWIKNNALFVADMEEGMVAEDSARVVDTMGMDKVQLDKVIHIVEALTEGRNDDSGYSGNKGF
jgi:hypothetical protein